MNPVNITKTYDLLGGKAKLTIVEKPFKVGPKSLYQSPYKVDTRVKLTFSKRINDHGQRYTANVDIVDAAYPGEQKVIKSDLLTSDRDNDAEIDAVCRAFVEKRIAHYIFSTTEELERELARDC